MASAPGVLRTNSLFLLVIHVVCGLAVGSGECNNRQCRFAVQLPAGFSWRLTPIALAPGEKCTVFSQDYDVREQPGETASAFEVVIEVTVPASQRGRLYLCRYQAKGPLAGLWIHQGTALFVEIEAAEAEQNKQSLDLQQTVGLSQDMQMSESLNDKSDLITKESWVDLSHDIDVNNEPGAPRPTREEASDILVLRETDQYVPLNMNYDVEKVESNNTDVREESVTEDYNRSKEELGDESVKRATEDELKFEDDAAEDLETNYIYEFPEVQTRVRKITELGASDRDVDDDSVIDLIEFRRKRASDNDEEESSQSVPETTTQEWKPQHMKKSNELGSSVRGESKKLKIEGFRVEKFEKPPENEDGIPSVLANTKVTLRLFGTGFTEDTYISFTHENGSYNDLCDYRLKGEYKVKPDSIQENTAEFEFTAPAPIQNNTFYFCATNSKGGLLSTPTFLHQGSDPWVTLMTHNKALPLWATLLLILICLCFSALFSGLNLGLMSLDRTELKIIANTGTEQEKKYARTIQPVRDHGNYLLCSILLGNVAVNSTFTILLDDLMSGLFAVIFSTLAIVCLGEIVPQAICSRHGLMISAKTIVVTKCAMGVTAPLAYPVSKLLDYFLGEEIGNVYNRERLKELVKVTNDLNDLDKDEVNIISGALEMRKKTVSEVMTRIEDVFMLSLDSVLDFETMSEIVKSGFSRIPVYEGTRNNIVTVLFIKDLAFVDPDDNTPLRTLCQFYQNPCNFVFEDTTLDVMFRQFKEGHKGHMAFVHRVNNEGEGDPFYETVGLVTLEDVIEEMIQAEIVDETDVFTDNRSKRRRNRPVDKFQDFAAFAERREHQRVRISPQLTLATFQFLSSSVEPFRKDAVSETVLRRLLRQDIIRQIKCKGKDKRDPSTLVYTQGEPVDYFVLILEGRVEVTVGRENLVFEAGPFTYFGVQALTQNVGVAESPSPSTLGSLQNINMDAMLRYTFVPDYSVRAVTDLLYIVIKRSLYLAAKRATLMEKTSSLAKGGGMGGGDTFDNEVDKLLQSMDEDVSVSGDQKTPSRQISPSQPPTSANPQTRSSFASVLSSPTRLLSSPGSHASQPVSHTSGGNGDVTYKFAPPEQIETDGDK